MPEIRATLEVVFGTAGTVLWMIQLIPQVYLNYRRRSTSGIAPILFIGWMISGLTLGPYSIVQDLAIPIQVQPYCYGTLCAIILSQWLYYDCDYSLVRSVAVFGAYIVFGGAVDVAIYFACKAAQDVNIQGVTIFFGAVSAFFLNIGFIPQLLLIYKAREVIGLSYAFLAMDSGGAVFSIMSLGFKEGAIDLVALLGYAVLLFFEIAILVLAAILNPRARRRRLLNSEVTVEAAVADVAPTAVPVETEEGVKERTKEVVV